MEKKEYSIVASAEAFDTLSSKLYSNPIAAIIRELSSNAYDSHIMANQKKPFDLHIPTEEEPFFKIRDYGVGMSDDFVMDVYTTYFASTKSTNNKQIGAFGLGSKTPYALVNEYKVTSYFNNKKTSYKMSKIKGLPSVEKISEEDTDEPTGLEIYFDINDNLIESNWSIFNDFEREARYFFSTSMFQPTWNLTLSPESLMDMAESKKYFNEDSAYLSCDNSIPNLSNSFRRASDISVNVAGVVFYVNKYDIGGLGNYDEDLDYFAKPINIMANKDDVTVVPSRENLHFDDKTINFIKDKVINLMKGKIDDFDNKVNNLEVNLVGLKNIIHSYCPDKVKDDAIKLIKENFGYDAYCEFTSRSCSHVSRDSFIDTYDHDNPFYGILDYSGCKTQQTNTVLNTIKEIGRKVSSKAFRDRVSYFFETFGSHNDSNHVIITINLGHETVAEKLLEGTNHKIFMYKDCAPAKNTSSTPKKKRGFITSTTYVYKNYEDVTTWERRNKDPYLHDDETPLVCSKSINRVIDLFPLLKVIKPNENLVIRCVSDDSVAKNVCSMTKVENIEDWIKRVISENSSTVEEFSKVTGIYNHIRNIVGMSPIDEELFNDDNMKKFEKMAITISAKELVDNINFVRNNQDKIWSDVTMLPNVNLNKYKSFDEKLFPLINFIGYSRTWLDADAKFKYIKSLLEYMVLVESNTTYFNQIKEEIAKEEEAASSEKESA